MRHAFTLVELAIVLVVIGLLAGGVLTGQSLIRAAELQTVPAEFEKYKTAANIFWSKYSSKPGDMFDAEANWGTLSTGGCPNGTAGVGTETCNGDGDGRIEQSSAGGRAGEMFAFWQHLRNAELIDGNFTGIAGSGDRDHSVIGTNSPRGDLADNATWSIQTNDGGGSLRFELPTETDWMILGGESTDWNFNPILTIEEAWNIDTKLDDGHATKGKVWAVRWNDCTPANNDTDYEDYDFGVTGLQCGLMFLDIFDK